MTCNNVSIDTYVHNVTSVHDTINKHCTDIDNKLIYKYDILLSFINDTLAKKHKYISLSCVKNVSNDDFIMSDDILSIYENKISNIKSTSTRCATINVLYNELPRIGYKIKKKNNKFTICKVLHFL